MTTTSHLIGKVDLSQIECRILNTVAGQWDVVGRFARGEDPYVDQASAVCGFRVNKDDHPTERQVGKVLELQAGYGSGEDTIRRTLRLAGLPIDDNISYRDSYRSMHTAVVEYWAQGGRMLSALMDGRTVQWGPLTIHDHRVFAPGGLWMDFTSLQYRVNVETGEKEFVHRVKKGWRKTYGARFVENVIQFMAGIVLRDGMLRIIGMGLRIPLTVHDDCFILIPDNAYKEETLERCKQAMSQPVEWLPECPIDCEASLQDALEK